MATTRRAFLTGVVASGLGTSLLGRAGLALPGSGRALDELDFGELESLAARIQETAPASLQGLLIDELRGGKRDLGTIVAATALANARTFGGEDYDGYHCMMALAPALMMAGRLSPAARPLPVLKVVYRTANRIQEFGGRSHELLHAVAIPSRESREVELRRFHAAVRDRDLEAAESAFAALSQDGPRAAYDALLSLVQEDVDVHRVVLAWRAWETLSLCGEQHANTLMRQCVHFCVQAEAERVRRGRPEPRLRALLPELLAEPGLAGAAAREAGSTRHTSDAELEELAEVVFRADREEAARAMVAALAAGWSHRDAGEALSLAANRLLLHDSGRSSAQPGKPAGSVHGASVGVHASDAARAWRNIAAVDDARHGAAGLIAGAFHTAGQSGLVGAEPFPYRGRMDELEQGDRTQLLAAASAAIEAGDQPLAAAAAARWCAAGHPAEPLFDLLLAYAVSEDGALHAEKYFATIAEEFAAARPAFRASHLVALARVTASEHGWAAPGVAEARERMAT